ncbi:serine/threonine-protein kinase [Yersinia pseudotuberculosis]|uniref:serine/threonine-protein kinase n=1 Tax=Yersinia pseudotuberculosis TaxID=633 RepID=UPI0004F787DB|nr:serine/threonine-protein kinase [Yersinia pseudotuberculosis]AIN15090.1 kinase domain protein [Yersinia pseudotuberculosis]MBO1561565.1 protein kinase [Yersinia pseudotuberculosis]
MDERHGNYYLRRMAGLGRGAFGYVEHIKLLTLTHTECGDYAIKVFSPQKPELIDQFRRRFKNEVIFQTRCVHKNIVPIYLFNLRVENPWFVMDKAECDLQYEINNNSLNLEGKLSIASMVLNGVNCIHERNYLHRDIKPNNVLKFNDGTYKVSDFGLVKDTDPEEGASNLTLVGTKMGTTKYMAPEILYNAEYSRQSDIYAVGKLIQDLSISDVRINPIVKKCIEMDKSNRYQNIDEILLDFKQIPWGVEI